MPGVVENHWRDRKRRNLERRENLTNLPLCIFLDDVDFFSEAWEKSFRIPGLATLRPDIPDTLSKATQDEITQKISQFVNSITDEQLTRVAVVIADQFWDNPPLQTATLTLINRLRQINQTAWILEVGAFEHPVYQGSNAVLQKGGNDINAASLIGKLPPNPTVRLQAIRTYSYEAFIQASLADPNSNTSALDRYSEAGYRERKFDQLERQENYHQILELLGLEAKLSLYEEFRSLMPPQQMLFIHCGWNLLGHLQLKHNEGYYSEILARLKQLLGLIEDSQDQ